VEVVAVVLLVCVTEVPLWHEQGQFASGSCSQLISGHHHGSQVVVAVTEVLVTVWVELDVVPVVLVLVAEVLVTV
jgi:hypothetical protein